MTLSINDPQHKTLCIECHYNECCVSFFVMLNVVMLNVIMLSCRYAKCRYAECRHADCHYAECRSAF